MAQWPIVTRYTFFCFVLFLFCFVFLYISSEVPVFSAVKDWVASGFGGRLADTAVVCKWCYHDYGWWWLNIELMPWRWWMKMKIVTRWWWWGFGGLQAGHRMVCNNVTMMTDDDWVIEYWFDAMTMMDEDGWRWQMKLKIVTRWWMFDESRLQTHGNSTCAPSGWCGFRDGTDLLRTVDIYTVSFLLILHFLAFKIDSFIYSCICLGFQQKKRIKRSAGNSVGVQIRPPVLILFFPYIAKRGMSHTADISSPAVHIFIIFSHFGTYWAHSE